MLKNLRQLLGVIHRIQLGAADHGHLMDVYLFCTDGLCGMMEAIPVRIPSQPPGKGVDKGNRPTSCTFVT